MTVYIINRGGRTYMKKLCIGLSIILLSACSASLNINLKEAIVIEYGDDIKVENLTDDEGMTLEEIKDYDSKKVEKQTVTAIFKKDDLTTEKKIDVEVKDTKGPEISFKEESISITEGDEFNAVSNIESIKDPVDGDIKLSEDSTILKDVYLIDSTVDMNTAGEYEVKVTAYDINGNNAEKSYTVSVAEKAEEEVASNGSINSGNANASSGGTSNKNNATSNNNSSGSSNNASTPPVSGNTSSGGSNDNTSSVTPPASNEKPVLCPSGTYPNKPCDYIIIGEGVPGNSGVWTPNEQEAINASHWIGDKNSEWFGKYSGSYVVDTEWNDGRIMYTVVFY